MATAKEKSTTKKTTQSRKIAGEPILRSFRRSRPTTPFFTFKVTNQTVYWLILSLFVLGLGVWVTYLNVKVQRIYDQIDLSSALRGVPDVHLQKSHH